MSDYMFMLESHLSAEQSRVVAAVQSAANLENVPLYLTGGAMRDMLGGFIIRDLDFTVEGNAPKLAKDLVKHHGATIVSLDEHRKSAELIFPAGVTCEVTMARREKYAKPGSKPQITPATIHEDLQGRDFTINAIALSLNRRSRGLLMDPTNGLADLERREIRATGNYTLYDDPTRLLRLIRFRTRLGFAVEERTQSQYQNAREAGVEARIPPRVLFEELRQMANESNPDEVVKAFEQEKLLPLYSPALSGAKVNHAGLAKLVKARQIVPFGVEFPVENLGLFLFILTEKLTPKEKTGLIKAAAMQRSEIDLWQKLEAKAKKLESVLKSAKLQKPSKFFAAASAAPGEQLLFLLVRSQQRIVQDRIRNFLQKHLSIAQEVTDAVVTEVSGLEPGSPKFHKAKDELIRTRLDARPKKVVVEPEPEQLPPPPPARSGFPGRR
jgi:tRNA nucleotidyltransferase (CCA-adding enzyme)